MSTVERGFLILTILIQKSSVKRPLSYKDIQTELLKTYRVKASPHTIKSAVNELSLTSLGIAEDDKGRVFIA
ncbi:MAG: hypothetical protein IKZ58_04110 [Selenomonadaceae bacterium]|nr:hypothetical protein [Selenomonadaceae bacterium]